MSNKEAAFIGGLFICVFRVVRVFRGYAFIAFLTGLHLTLRALTTNHIYEKDSGVKTEKCPHLKFPSSGLVFGFDKKETWNPLSVISMEKHRRLHHLFEQ